MQTLTLPLPDKRYQAIARNISKCHTVAQMMGCLAWMEHCEQDYPEEIWTPYLADLVKKWEAKYKSVVTVTNLINSAFSNN